MTARDRVLALWTERGWAVGTSVGLPVDSEPGPYRAWASNGDGPDACTEAFGPTEDAACEALLAKLEPASLPRLAPTLRGEVRVLLDWVCARRAHWEDDLGRITAATPAQREAWLAAFPDEPAGVRRPAYHEFVTGPDGNCDLLADPGDEDQP